MASGSAENAYVRLDLHLVCAYAIYKDFKFCVLGEVVEGQQEVAFAAQVTDSDKLLDDGTSSTIIE